MLIRDQTAKPIMKAPAVVERDCDVCDGRGSVLEATDDPELDARAPCPTCRGRGRVWEPAR